MPFSSDITAKLLELKQDSGLTYEQIGIEVRTSDTNVRRYINGEVKTPDRKLLFAIVRAIGGDPDTLFAPKPTPSNPTPAGLDYALYDRVVANMEARYQQQERQHAETISKLQARLDHEVAAIQASSDQAIRSKDEWIGKIRSEITNLETERENLRRIIKLLITVSLLLSGAVLLLVLSHFVPALIH